MPPILHPVQSIIETESKLSAIQIIILIQIISISIDINCSIGICIGIALSVSDQPENLMKDTGTDFHRNQQWWEFHVCVDGIFSKLCVSLFLACACMPIATLQLLEHLQFRSPFLSLSVCVSLTFDYLYINHRSIVIPSNRVNRMQCDAQRCDVMCWCANKWLIGLFYTLWFIICTERIDRHSFRFMWMDVTSGVVRGLVRFKLPTKCQAYYLYTE